MIGLLAQLTPEQKEKALSFTGDDNPPKAGIPWSLPLDQDGRDMSGENLMGMRVAAWREESRFGSEYGHTCSYHWSTPGAGAKNVERLFTETDVRAKFEELLDRADGLEADLDSAVEVAFRRGARDWTRLNYPDLYQRFLRAEEAEQA